MKNVVKLLIVVVALAVNSAVPAGNPDVEIRCVPRKAGSKVNPGSGEGGKAVAKDSWVYDITIENKTFRDLADLEVKYIIFFKQERLGSKEPAKSRRQNGSLTLPLLKAREKKTLATEPVQLTTASLIGAYYYPDGAKIKTQDSLDGLWVRVYQNGQQFAEYANPSVLTREKWE